LEGCVQTQENLKKIDDGVSAVHKYRVHKNQW
jgi:hypothetical protein